MFIYNLYVNMCGCVCMPVLVIVLIENCNLFMFEWKVVSEKV